MGLDYGSSDHAYVTIFHSKSLFKAPRRGCGGPEKDRDFVGGDEYLV